MPARRALVLANRDDCDPGFIGDRARHHGYDLTVLAREDAHATAPFAADLVLVLGSDWSVYWPERATEVAAEQALLRTHHEQGVPIFGICYGAQILAAALGGSVRRAEPVGELGWYRVDSDDPGLVPPGPWFQWHGDTFTPPPGATTHARSPVGPQAFALGRTLAVQFHPEVTHAIVARWVGGGRDELDAAGVHADALLARTQAETPRAEGDAHRLFDRFLADVTGEPPAAPPPERPGNDPAR